MATYKVEVVIYVFGKLLQFKGFCLVENIYIW